MNMAIEYGKNTSYDDEIMMYLLNIFGPDAFAKVKEYHKEKFNSDKIVTPEKMNDIIHNCYVISNETDVKVFPPTKPAEGLTPE